MADFFVSDGRFFGLDEITYLHYKCNANHVQLNHLMMYYYVQSTHHVQHIHLLTNMILVLDVCCHLTLCELSNKHYNLNCVGLMGT